ncbi:MAG TPA: hypothetical protein VLT36_09225 [Candidatus Dormibacteraeota bacterium]|nr:hypothetical protein [Candidatus Dormibacteraeota bacterium]
MLRLNLPRAAFDLLSLALVPFGFVNGIAASAPIGWSQLPNTPGPNSTRHDDICFVDPTNGWSSQNHFIHRTTDGGLTWRSNVFSGTHFRSVAFTTTKIGFAGNLGPGSYDGGTTDPNVLYRSYDGGVTWTNVPGFAEAGMNGLCALFVLDSQHIYGAGRVRGPAHFIKSVDGGTNWSILSLTAAGVMNGIMDVYFHDSTNGWVVGMDTNLFTSPPYYGRVARTTDGGNTWTPVLTTPIADSYFWKISWPTRNIGYVALQQNDVRTNIVFYKTTDGGNTWVLNAIPEVSVGLNTNSLHFYLQGLGFVSPTEGWIGGASGFSTYPSSFLHTVDGGATWTPVGFNDTFFINRIRFASPNLGYGSGANIYIYNMPVVITNQPQSQVVVAPTNVSLGVGVSGAGPLSYQWRKDGLAAVGATNATLVLTGVSRTNVGAYSVLVTNASGSAQSSNAILTVLVPERLSSPAIIPGGKVRLVFGDSDGGAVLTTNDLQTFKVQASTNLTDWTVLTNTLSLTNGMVVLEDAWTNAPTRYYRVSETY